MNFFRSYNRTMAAAFLAVLLVLGAFFGFQLEQRLDDEIATIETHLNRHAQLLEYVLRTSDDQIDALRIAADGVNQALGPGQSPKTRTPANWPSEAPDGRSFNLDLWADRDTGGNLVGLGPLRGRQATFTHELQRALGLNPLMRALTFNLPSAARVQFVSEQNFELVSPWVASETHPFSKKTYDAPSWQMALPGRNPDRQKYWAPPRFGGPDQGLLMPVAAPVYDQDHFVGVVSIDTSLDYLNRVNAGFDYPLGTVMLVNKEGQVLAHPQLFAKPLEVEETPLLKDALPQALVQSGLAVSDLPEDQHTVVAGYVLLHKHFVAAPFDLVYLVPQSELLWRLAASEGGAMLLVLLGLCAMLVLTYVITRRDFVGPAAHLVQHLSSTSQMKAVAVPHVPAAWQPWFDMVSRVFRESQQLAAMQQELDTSAEMQRAILPTRWPQSVRYTLRGSMRSAKQVGGDFFDHFELGASQRGIVVADVSGKGVPAGLFAMVSRTQLRAIAMLGAANPNQTLTKVNNALCEGNDSCMFVTGVYAIFDPDTGRLVHVNFGHPPPLLIHADGRLQFIDSPPCIPIGLIEDADYQHTELQLLPGDILVMYTDGVTEAMNPELEEFGASRLLAVFESGVPASAEIALQQVIAAVNAFAAGAEQSDDITCIALHYHP